MRTNLRRRLDPARLAAAPLLRCQTDEELVELARDGHEPAFEAIVERYRKPLLRYARRIAPAVAAEDVLQRTFLAAHRVIREGEAELNLRGWLYRVAHNASIDVLREEGRGHHAQIDESLDGIERPEQALERSQRVREVVAALQALPERQREALVLRELEGRAHSEIATKLGVSDGAVRQLIHRARSALRSAASALVPPQLLQRLLSASREDPSRAFEVAAGAGATGVAVKAGATVLATAAIVTAGPQGLPSPSQAADRGAGASIERGLAGRTAGDSPPPVPAPAAPVPGRKQGKRSREAAERIARRAGSRDLDRGRGARTSGRRGRVPSDPGGGGTREGKNASGGRRGGSGGEGGHRSDDELKSSNPRGRGKGNDDGRSRSGSGGRAGPGPGSGGSGQSGSAKAGSSKRPLDDEDA